MPRLLIAAGGTGGHLFPALALADSLPNNWEIYWLGTHNSLEIELVPKRFQLITVSAEGLQGSILRRVRNLLWLLLATLKLRRFILREQIDAVFTTGGYVAAPAILAARWTGLPAVLHESNAVPGRVTRLLGSWCRIVALGLAVTANHLNRCTTAVTGTPVRATFLRPQSLPAWVPQADGPLLVVIGGSQGAVGLNRMVRNVLPALLKAGCRVVHLTGCHDPDIGQMQHPAFVERLFSSEIPGLLQHADLAISRAGAGSLSELAACCTPAILVPFPYAVDQHQTANAACAAALGAAVVIHEHAPDHPALGRALWHLLAGHLQPRSSSVDLLVGMRAGMKQLGARDANQLLAKLMIRLYSK
ncbi:UDP-N-acetylglucosamine--N-acetylmuramyl-(pentapeptide) pyrophosphoryl-undecaprenol N-acetylglucosamine transferase [cyanobiont of Ornithocercus magnificus]|nr:UDP-N-acetylglucosamine--N-acetylmuramyl-(pentapeptide) pyrophosphoryl-undecaprenol N-acetylglucosamine transferase [cyanobiont of Ornithocercus magnificus]